jgi:hypothetical protein
MEDDQPENLHVAVAGRLYNLGQQPQTNNLRVSRSSARDEPTLSWGLNQWRIIVKADGRPEGTVEWVEGAIKLLQDFLGDIPLSAVTPQEMRRFVIALRQRHVWQGHPYAKPSTRLMSPGTINNRCRAIKSFFGTLVKEKIVDENPLYDWRVPSAGESVPKTLSKDQMIILLNQPDQRRPEQFRDFVVMSLFYDSISKAAHSRCLERVGAGSLTTFRLWGRNC